MVPNTQKAIVIQGPGVAKLVHDRPIPKLREDYVLLKTAAVALNPTDWKHIKYLIKKEGPLVGCDYAGTVEEVGSKVTNVKKGDRIYGVAHGSNSIQPEDGAFAEYIMVKSASTAKVPDNMSFEQAATLGVALVTIGLGFYQKLQLAWPTSPLKETEPILIYGGSTATGVIAIQFAKLSGYTVITTNSPHNNELVKSYGADVVFDYKDPDVGKKIREYTNNKLTHVFDTISSESSAKISADALSESGGSYNSLGRVQFPRDDVKTSLTLGYTGAGEDFYIGDTFIPGMPADLELTKKFFVVAGELVAAGKIKVHKSRVRHGLEGILDGLKEMEEGKISGEKLVYTVQ